MTVIATLGEREYRVFENLVSTADTDLVKLLTRVMGFMKNEQSIKQLRDLLHHASAAVRKEALSTIFQRNSNMAGELSWMLNDPDEGIQRLFLHFAGQKRDRKTEKQLLDYLRKKHLRSGNKEILFRAYSALGKCGSDASLPLLRKNLFFLPILGLRRSKKSLRCQASLFTLRELNTPAAETLLERVNN